MADRDQNDPNPNLRPAGRPSPDADDARAAASGGPDGEAPDAAAEAALDAAREALNALHDDDDEGDGSDRLEPMLTGAGPDSAERSHGSDSSSGRPVALEEFTRQAARNGAAGGLELLSRVNLSVRVELGRTRMLVEDVLRLNEGAVVELDKLAGDPVDIFVNDRHVARGEVLVLNDTFCVRVSEILPGAGVRDA